MNPEKRVVRLEKDGPKGAGLQPMDLDPADFQSPPPMQNIHVYYEDANIGLTVGVWDTTSMQEAFGPYPGDEFIWVLEGHFAMLDADNNAVRAQRHDAVSFRNCTPVSWKQDGYLKKFFITYLDPNARTPKINSADGGVTVMSPNAELTRRSSSEPFEISGLKPLQRNHTMFTNDTGNLSAGVWDSQVMVSTMRPFPIHEFVQMLEGEIEITEKLEANRLLLPVTVFSSQKGRSAAGKSKTMPRCITRFWMWLDAT